MSVGYSRLYDFSYVVTCSNLKLPLQLGNRLLRTENTINILTYRVVVFESLKESARNSHSFGIMSSLHELVYAFPRYSHCLFVIHLKEPIDKSRW